MPRWLQIDDNCCNNYSSALNNITNHMNDSSSYIDVLCLFLFFIFVINERFTLFFRSLNIILIFNVLLCLYLMLRIKLRILTNYFMVSSNFFILVLLSNLVIVFSSMVAGLIRIMIIYLLWNKIVGVV